MTRYTVTIVLGAALGASACVIRATDNTTAGDATGTTDEATAPGSSTPDPSDPTGSTSATSSTGAPTTGPAVCPLAVGPYDEPPEQDPDACFAVTDEAGCAAMGDACIGLFGVPAECSDSQWCLPDADVSIFLGCRPFAICKLHLRAVCTATDTGIHAFFTAGCTPMGFGPCEPEFAQSSDPPTCG